MLLGQVLIKKRATGQREIRINEEIVINISKYDLLTYLWSAY